MKTITNICALLLLSSVWSCSNDKPEHLYEPSVIIDDFHSYKLDMGMDKVKLADLIESIEVMKLEETRGSLLGYVYNLAESPNGYLLNGNKLFNKDGEFVRGFNQRGAGPDQYSEIRDYWVEGDAIAIFTGQTQYIKRYDFEGNFISAFKLPFYTQHIYPIEKGFVYDLSYEAIKDSLKYRLLVADSDHQLKATYFPFEVYPTMHYFSQSPSLKPYGNGVTYLGAMSDSLYQVDYNGVRPLAHFDFREEWYWNEETKMNPKMYMASQGKKVDFIDPYIGEKYIWLGARFIMTDNEHFVINRLTKSIVSIDIRNDGDGRHSIIPIKWSGDKFLASIQSNDLGALLNELDEYRLSFKEGTTLEEIESSENPALIWVKFKDFK